MLSFKSFIKKLLEGKKEKVVFVFGRMNPPTKGHEKMVSFALSIANQEDADFKFYVSHTRDKKRNPLTYDEKVSAIKTGMPKLASYFVTSSHRTIFQIIDNDLSKYKSITLVVGEDRADAFTASLKKYGINIKHIDRADGISATAMRDAVKADDFKTFQRGLPSGFNRDTAQELFSLLKTRL